MADGTQRADVSSENVIKRYFDMVYKLALSQTKNKTAADDVVQEVFLRYIEHEGDFKDTEHIKAWLIRVTINCSKSTFLSSWYRKTEPLTEDLVFTEPEKSEVYYSVLELDLKYRAVIHLYYYEDMSVEEISKALNIKTGTVKSRLYRGREMLKKKLKGGYDFV